MKRAMIVGAVALAVVLIARRVMDKKNDPYNPASWDYLPGYNPGAGVMV